ncbi:DSC E3 ubiquitin ligase complex subunit 2 [Staphylotrichum tortipilum]|uniref:DSC E3 ubiquitin ligase complex subunit 2 n=1 Tax=Staphylotrichum tortipilum TaxID=2831512 RepID=A0AAN6MBD1_9PEZI|nr:DSC E3 ubiquitin ligase complex subunit 2 [Staphylotrichum longicolle]
MSFQHTPVTRTLVLGLVGASIAASLFDMKHYFYISVGTHILQYRQTWRALVWQLCYTNSSEVLFAAMTLYHMRVVEQFWGSRKYASFVLVSALLTSIIPPVLLTVVLRPLTWGVFDFLPAGPTPIIFAVLAQYHAMVPQTYRYKIPLSTGAPKKKNTNKDGGSSAERDDHDVDDDDDDTPALTFSDKSTRYLMALQLALFQWPGSLLGAGVGWLVGRAWHSELVPGALLRWRVPGWVVGMRSQKKSSERFEGMRRRLESEGATTTGAASGVQQNQQQQVGGGGDANRRRTMGQQFMDEVRGAF